MFPLPLHFQWFAVAGLAAAAGPILIHLLNRQRFKVVDWAAMEFLRQAVRRSRRILRLRDLLLLAIRTLCVLLFGLALAQPYRQATSAAVDPSQPVHAVLLVDNSLSMAYQQLDGTVLDEARKRAEDYVDRLPPGSRISVLPLCGSETEFSRGAYRTKEDALEALAAVGPVDRQATATMAVDLAKEACRRVPTPASKQIVLLSDQQAGNWRVQSLEADLEQLPCPIQIVRVGPQKRENAWVEDFQVQDGLADLSVPAVFLAKIRYEGDAPRHDVQVTLAVDGAAAATQTISLQPGQTSEVQFPPYQLDVAVQPGQPTPVTAEVSIPHDELPGDDQRQLIVPVVASLPVVFIDQCGPDEDPARNVYGETYRLRHLLASRRGGQGQPELIKVRHLKIQQLARDGRQALEDARLVVIAGVDDPADTVSLLREYVQQGGTLVLAAGGAFDPVAWNDAAWLDGLGILPAPLEPEMVGRLPSETRGMLEPFLLDFGSLMGEYFRIEQEPEERLKALYGRAFFFKAVEADVGEEARQQMIRTLAGQIEKDRREGAEIDRNLVELAAVATPTEAQRKERVRLEELRDQTQPRWLLWAGPQQDDADASLSPRELAEKKGFATLARYTSGVPFLIERSIGRGRVLFVSSGVFREWNNMTAEYPVVVFDRIFRRALHGTLPVRNLSTTERLVLPVEAAQRHARFVLADPQGREKSIVVDALGPDRFGLSIEKLPHRGIYRVTAYGTRQTPQEGLDSKLWEVPLAAGGPAEESELAPIDEASLGERLGEAEYRWIAPGQTISLSADPLGRREMWKWLILAVFLGLFVELAILAWPSLPLGEGRGEGRTSSSAGGNPHPNPLPEGEGRRPHPNPLPEGVGTLGGGPAA